MVKYIYWIKKYKRYRNGSIIFVHMKLNDIATGQKIHNHIRRKIHKSLIIILLIFAVILFVSAFIDLNEGARSSVYSVINEDTRRLISDKIEKFYDMLITISTILAATVIFFYSVQDNRREGIPHRAILAYSFGSYAIPVFFFLSIIILPMGFWLFHFDMKATFMVCTVFSFASQVSIMALILFSTSFTYGLRVIRNAEIRQYRMLCENKGGNNSELESNPQFIWTYLLHHLEQVVTSEELIADKMMLVRELLKTPYHKKQKGWRTRRKNRDGCVNDMLKLCLEKNSPERIYEFYYGNLSAVMQYLSRKEHNSERDKIYLVLYEFLDSMKRLYEMVKKSESGFQAGASANYMMTVSGLMNAVLDSETPDAEVVCNYILNKCISDHEMREKQIGLYFLFQEYLYRTRIEGKEADRTIPIQYIGQINGVAEWRMKDEDEEIYFDFWQIWMNWTSLSEKSRMDYFRNAIAALRGENYYAGLVSHIMLWIKIVGKMTNENQGNSVNE